jgi:hypothetical protein
MTILHALLVTVHDCASSALARYRLSLHSDHISMTRHCCRLMLLLQHLLFILTCVQASGVLAAPLPFFIQVTGKSAPRVAVIALEPGVCGSVMGVAELVVLQVRLGCLLRGVEPAEVFVVAG